MMEETGKVRSEEGETAEGRGTGMLEEGRDRL